MNRTWTTLLLIFIVSFANSQPIDILNKSDKKFKKRGKGFEYINPTTDTLNYEFIATLKTKGRKSTADIGRLYINLSEKARIIGANSFKLNSFERNVSQREIELTIDIYFASDSVKRLNRANHAVNVIYLFGDSNFDTYKTYSFTINDQEKLIHSGQYLEVKLNEGEHVKIRKGGIAGSTVTINWENGKSAVYLSLSNFGFGGVAPPPGNSGYVVSFYTGKISYLDENIGQLLVNVLDKAN